MAENNNQKEKREAHKRLASIFAAHLASRYSGYYRGGHGHAGLYKPNIEAVKKSYRYYNATLTKIERAQTISFPTNS